MSSSSIVMSNVKAPANATAAAAKAKANIEARFTQVKSIIDATVAQPTIVNPASRFVVVTYWWGRGNLNKNTARPCGDYFERLLETPLNGLIQYPRMTDYKTTMLKDAKLARFMRTQLEKYIRERDAYVASRTPFGDAQIPRSAWDVRSGKPTPAGFQGTEGLRELTPVVLDQLFAVLPAAIPHIHALQDLAVQRLGLEEEFDREMARQRAALEAAGEAVGSQFVPVMTDAYKHQINALHAAKGAAKAALKAAIRPALAALYDRMAFMPPLRYEEMIQRWEETCRAAGCNYMAVEYPEFAAPGGYQLAINAKPRFIQKALQLCEGRGVLYIDGDMTVKRYPAIFDMEDVDMMARGWHVDPRSSYKHTYSIVVDPYVFETSGGTMFFGMTPEAALLLQRWIEVSERPSQFGKADDRILSLIFTTMRMLLPMKIVQLPIEYLWLSLDYDDSVEDEIRDDRYMMLEHPECLTSEDTATDRGASSSRTPLFYSALDEPVPRSEFLMEQVMFDGPEQVEAMKPYLNYLSEATYFEDVEEMEGEQPFYVVPYGKGLGKFQEAANRNGYMATQLPPLSEEELEDGVLVLRDSSASNMNRVAALATEAAPVELVGGKRSGKGTGKGSKRRSRKSRVGGMEDMRIPRILQALRAGISVLYMPDGASEKAVAEMHRVRKTNPRLEFIFTNASRDMRSPFFYQAEIETREPIFFKAGNRKLQQLISMCASFEDMRGVYTAAYQFLSRIRTHYMNPAGLPADIRRLVQNALNGSQMGGDLSEATNVFGIESARALEFLYGSSGQAGGRRLKATRRGRRTGRKMTRRR